MYYSLSFPVKSIYILSSPRIVSIEFINSATYQNLDLANLNCHPFDCHDQGLLLDLYTGTSPDIFEKQLVLAPFGFYWLIKNETQVFINALI